MRFVGRCYRGHDPAWSFSPISGAGAALTGGRFNPKGEPTLYLSLDIMTSFGECTQGLRNRLQPLTMCEYDVDCEGVADLRNDATRAVHGVAWDEISCAWLDFELDRKEAPSWLVADRLKAAGHSGILVSSFVAGATDANNNLVLWRWGRDLPHRVNVYDPSNRLPANQRSWPRVAPRGAKLSQIRVPDAVQREWEPSGPRFARPDANIQSGTVPSSKSGTIPGLQRIISLRYMLRRARETPLT